MNYLRKKIEKDLVEKSSFIIAVITSMKKEESSLLAKYLYSISRSIPGYTSTSNFSSALYTLLSDWSKLLNIKILVKVVTTSLSVNSWS